LFDLSLRGDVVAITGSASGIGRACAEMFASHYAKVVLIDHNPSVTAIAESIAKKHQVETLGLVVDVTDYSAVIQAAETAQHSFGPCSHLVCGAGIGSGKFGFPFWSLQPNDWHAVWQVNVMGTVHATHAFIPSMIEARDGTLLFLASIAGQIGSQTDPPYSAAKAAVINFGQCAAKDLAEFNVRVNVICPGMIKTPLNESVWQAWKERQPESLQLTYEQWAQDKIQKAAPLNRWQQPEDVAAMATFLASPYANNVTGQTINVDGGQVMRG